MRFRMLLFFFLLPAAGFTQTLSWWSNLVNWDGASHWYTYLITSPKYFGPNAFSVPAINNGRIDSISSLGMTGNFHFSKGDNTQNLMLYGNYVAKGKDFSVDAQFVPYEQFQLSHAKKEERRVYYKDYYTKKTVGDVIINTTVQLFDRLRKKNIFTAVRVGIRMPSGGAQGAARYADVPSYWIDAGIAVQFKNPAWRWINMAGFLVWQTNEDDLRQDDAFLFGSGIEWNQKGLMTQLYGAGYLGYKNNGDKPIVIRLTIEKRYKRLAYLFRLQQGVHDFSYFTAEAGGRLLFVK